MDRVRRLAAAQATLAAEIKARSRRLWSVSLFAGRTSLDKIVGTELQATWAGALWLRRPIRRQLGAQLLMGAASTPEQWAYGVVMWALGAGDRPDRVYAMAEPFLDQAGSDFVVRTLAEAEVAPKYGHRFLSVAAEAWDGVSDDALRWCVERVEPSAGDDPDALLTQAVWAGYAVRLEDEWHQRFADLSEDVRIAQVERLGADAVRHLSAANRRHVFDVASSAVLRQEPASAQLLRVLASAGSGSLAVSLRDAIRAKMSASVIAQLADEERGVLLDSGDVLRARDTLMAWVKEEATEAAQGQVSFGGTDTRVLLGRAVAATSEASADAVAVLMKLATDGGAPGEHIMNARIALTTVRRAGNLSPADHDVLHRAGDPLGTFVEHGDISVAVLRARRFQVVALDLTTAEAISVVGACGSEDPRVRQVALVTAGEAVGSSTEVAECEALAWAVVGGLFDPIDDVVRTAAGAVTAKFLARHPAAGAVALDRLPRLQQEGDVRLREAVATMVRRLVVDSPELTEDPRVAPTPAHADTDRSWVVRVAGRP